MNGHALPLRDRPNIGPTIAARLAAAGIEIVPGALEGRHWNALAPATKAALSRAIGR